MSCEALHFAQNDTSLVRFSATSFALYDWCPLAWRRRYRQGVSLDWENPTGLGSDVGAIVHWLLAKWDFEPLELSSDMTLQFPPRLRGAFRELLSDKKNLGTVKNWVENLRNSSTINELKSKNLMREVWFKVLLGKLRLVGAIDLCWEDDNENFHIRDWKTNPDASEAVEKMHESQLLFYGAAMKKLGKKISSLGVLSVRNGAERLFGTNLDGIDEKITQCAKDAVREMWKPNMQNCEKCLWHGKCGV